MAGQLRLRAATSFARRSRGPRPPLVHTVNSYLRKAIVSAHHDPVVARAVADVQNLLASPPSLLRSAITIRVGRAARRADAAAQLASQRHDERNGTVGREPRTRGTADAAPPSPARSMRDAQNVRYARLQYHQC